LSSYLSARCYQPPPNVQDGAIKSRPDGDRRQRCISRGRVATRSTSGEIFDDDFTADSMLRRTVK